MVLHEQVTLVTCEGDSKRSNISHGIPSESDERGMSTI